MYSQTSISGPVLSQMNPIHASAPPPSYMCKIYFSSILHSAARTNERYFYFKFSNQIPVCMHISSMQATFPAHLTQILSLIVTDKEYKSWSL
jgi:hypothetical protein